MYLWNVHSTATHILIDCRLLQYLIFLKSSYGKLWSHHKKTRHHLSIIKKTNPLILCREIVAVHSKNHAEHNTTCWQNARKFNSNVTAGCARGHFLRNLSCSSLTGPQPLPKQISRVSSTSSSFETQYFLSSLRLSSILVFVCFWKQTIQENLMFLSPCIMNWPYNNYQRNALNIIYS